MQNLSTNFCCPRQEFTNGATRARMLISEKFEEGQLSALEPLMTPEVHQCYEATAELFEGYVTLCYVTLCFVVVCNVTLRYGVLCMLKCTSVTWRLRNCLKGTFF
jgi:hypothetical protein